MKIINLTQHDATPEQIEAGVFEPKNKEAVRKLLTFDTIATKQEIEERAAKLANLAYLEGAEAAMIGGAPYLMSALERALKAKGIKPLYAFSVRRSIETKNPDGTVTKSTIFKHEGFIEV